MAKVKTKPKQYIPQIVRENGLQEVWDSGRVETVEQTDPDNPKRKVTRLRRKCVYDEMLARGSITQEQRDLAELYAILCEKAFGGSANLYSTVNYFSSGVRGNYNGPTMKQSVACDRLFKVWNEMGKYHHVILDLIVLGNMSTKQISEKMRLNLNYTMGQVLSTFILLEEAMKDS